MTWWIKVCTCWCVKFLAPNIPIMYDLVNWVCTCGCVQNREAAVRNCLTLVWLYSHSLCGRIRALSNLLVWVHVWHSISFCFWSLYFCLLFFPLMGIYSFTSHQKNFFFWKKEINRFFFVSLYSRVSIWSVGNDC